MIFTILQAAFAFILILGPLVFVHEFGHFIVAKMFGIGVPVFSLGFGPRLTGFRRGGTDYRLSAIPLGGYVRLAGDEADENRRGLPEEFLSRPKWQRFFVFVAGATFNVILAFLVGWFLFAHYGTEELIDPEPHPTVQGVRPDSAAERAGLQAGDVVLSFGGREFRPDNLREVLTYEVALAPGTLKTAAIQRGAERLELQVEIEAGEEGGQDPGWVLAFGSEQTSIIKGVAEGSPAERAGLQPEDRIVAVAGEPVEYMGLLRILEESPGKIVTLRIQRGEELLDVRVTPEDREGKGKIGVDLRADVPTYTRDYSLFEAARESLRENLNNSVMLFIVLKRMATSEVPATSVSGPIGIATYARQALLTSPKTFIWMLGFFSLQLGILNLLPIPVLDGGHILILMVEGVLRRDLSERVKERVMQVGFVFLVGLMLFVFTSDVLKLF